MVTISLCMIVRNEEEVLGRCLDSVQAAADEIVIVDTGSEDQTKEIAERYTKKVYELPWADDFAGARNVSFSKASMDYCMWIDADDVISPPELERLLLWKKQADGTADAVMMKYAAGMDEQGKETFVYYRERLLKRDRGFVWKGRVHEAVLVSGKVEYLDIRVEHHSQKKQYGDRNLRIYERMKAEGEPFSERDLFYYARELYYHGKYKEAKEGFLFFLEQKGGFSENQAEACRFLAYSLYALGEEEEALQALYRGLRYRVPGGELCCDLGKHFADRQMWAQAVFWYEAALHAGKDERSGGFIQEEYYGYVPCVQLCVCFSAMGEQEKAYACHQKSGTFKPYGKEFLKNEEYFRSRGK